MPNLPNEPAAAESGGGYSASAAHTLGGFDRMTGGSRRLVGRAVGEGRQFWIVARSDSHARYTESTSPRADFCFGEFHKAYVFARRRMQTSWKDYERSRLIAWMIEILAFGRIDCLPAFQE